MMDRRTIVAGMIGLAGAGVSYRWVQAASLRSEGGVNDGASAPAQPPLRQAATTGLSSVTLAQIPLGAGGFVTGLDVSADAQRFVCRTDACNAYVRDAQGAAWRPLFSPSTMKPADYDPLPPMNGKTDAEGVAGLRMAPSDKNTIFASYYGYVWKSLDGGRSVQRTRLQQVAMPSNAGWQRLFNRTIDIHPRDARRVLVGTWGEGVWYTTDGGDAWDRIELPLAAKSHDGQPGIHLVLFDPAGSDRVYVFVTGVGLYGSEAGLPGPFTPVQGGPRFCSHMTAGADGTLFLCEHSGEGSGQIWRYSPTARWNSVKPEHEAFVIAINPRQSNQLVAINPDGFFMTSSDGGKSFRSVGGAVWGQPGGEVGWTKGLHTMFPADVRFDPGKPDQLVIAQGVGVAKGSLSDGKFKLIDWSAGIEELCSVAALSVPGGKTFLSAWDKPFWRLDHQASYSNDFRYPVTAGKRHEPSYVVFGSYMDYAGDNRDFMVGVVNASEASAPGYTDNGGDSWRAFEGVPATGWGQGGCIAASTTKNFVLLPSNNGTGIFTLDGGKTWAPIKLDGVNPTSRFSNAYYVARKNVTADKSRPGTFALVYTVLKNDELEEPMGGVWLTKDGGRSWTQTLKGVINEGSHVPAVVRQEGQENRQFWQCQLEYVPGASGELVYTPHADFSDDRFFWSRDDGENWVELNSAIRNVTSFGFGKPFPGQSRPAVFFWGKVKGKLGLYVSTDWFRSVPLLVTRFPSQMLANVNFVGADPNKVGRAYVGTSCAGWVQVDVA